MIRNARTCLMLLAAICLVAGMRSAVAESSELERIRIAQKPASAVEPLDIKLVRNKVIEVGGKEIRQSAAQAKPGEVLEEIATYTNRSNSTLTKLEATLPVPANTELLMSTIRPANAYASADGKVFSPIPLKRKVRQADGIEVEQVVPLNEYRFLRWYPGALGPASSLVVSARFKLSNNGAPTNPPASGK